MEIDLSTCGNCGIDIPSDDKLSELEYADDVALLSKDPSRLQICLDRLNDKVHML